MTRDPPPAAAPAPVPRGLPAPWWAAITALAIAIALHRVVVSGDALLYTAIGHFILEHGALPVTDPFSDLSARAPLVLHFLLPMVSFAWLDSLFGLPALAAMGVLASAAALIAFLAPARRSAAATLAGAALLGLLVWVDFELFQVRAQTFGYLFFVASVALCRRVLAGRTRGVLLAGAALVALWANTHPSFPLAIVLPLAFAAATAVDDRRRARAAAPQLVALSAVGLAAACVSPYGPALLVDVLRLLLTDGTTHRIQHMRSPPAELGWLFFFAALAGVAAWRAVAGPRRDRRQHVILAAVWIAATLVSRRYAPFAAAWSVVLLVALLEHVSLRAPARRGLAIATGIAAMIGVVLMPPPRPLHRALPRAAVNVVETLPLPGRLLNEFGWGGYLMYRFGGRRPVFLDGRNNLYSANGVFDDYMHLVHASPRLDELLDVYDVNTVLWTRGWDLDRALAARADTWQLVYRDDKAVVYVRRGATALRPSGRD